MAVNIKGVDVSAWQKGISFDALKESGVKFVLIRAGAGTRIDGEAENFVRQCEKFGFDYGFYWFSYALSVEEAKREAEMCVNSVNDYSPAYPVYFDMEDISQIKELDTKTRTEMAVSFCERVKAAGYTAGVYANPSWLLNYYDREKLVGKYEIWLAHWTESPDKPSKYDFGQKIHQWGLDKIGGYDVDGDVSYFDYGTAHGQETGALNNGRAFAVKVEAFGTLEAAQNFVKYVNQKGLSAEITLSSPKTVREIALEVWAGKWSNGAERKKLLTEAGYDYSEVQRAVKELAK